MNASLFSDDIVEINLPQAKLIFIDHFFKKEEADAILSDLTENIGWEQGEIMMFGKKVLEPRLSAWYGDEGKEYTYSGKKQTPLAWTDTLKGIKNKIELECQNSIPPDAELHCAKCAHQYKAIFNSVLLNYYRNGQDSMGWHSDDEKELGRNPTIVSLNLGETRRFLIRHKIDKNLKKEILLTHGSLLIMTDEMQHYWQHAVPKEPKKQQPRINLTFRWII
jgi:alkylated DNA repair dioxygenase AlkB